MKISFFVLAAINLLFIGTFTLYAQVVEPHWSCCGNAEKLSNYSCFTKSHKNGSALREEFIQRTTDKKPILFYSHHRIIEFTLGHLNRLVFINDEDCNSCNKVMISDLDTRKSHPIDGEVIQEYQKSAPGSKDCFFPEAKAISPDDNQVLIHIRTNNLLPPFNYQDWSYVVNSTVGKILKAYKTKTIPAHWWVEPS